ncbi:MAG TPA: TusE/DsrC/DsvC family sulfur relay protein [Candidatus Methylomirabilis sp.]|nr:TusE/DsrC/DsvC family sulfur relay protein [Candidatus Methylomirabilis sp.]
MALKVNGREFDTDEEGFLLDPHDWNETVAREFAPDEMTLDG